MKENIKEEILLTARDLFNEEGFNNVSMRDIAKANHIRVGNLTYHYPHKLDILCALLHNGEPSIDIENIKDLHGLSEYLKQMIEGVIENRFFFGDSQMQSITEEAYQFNKDAVEQFRTHLLHFLKQLKKNEILSSNLKEDDMKTIISFWMLSHVTYGRENIKDSTYTNDSLNHFLLKHFVLLKPYLTDKGNKEYNQLKKELR